MKRLESYYIVGFVDGEGTFNLVKYPKGRTRPQFLVFNTNRKILEMIRQTLKIKSPIYEVVRVKDVIKSRKKCYRLQVRALSEIEKVVRFFDKNLPKVKISDYKIFRKQYKIWLKSL